MNYLCLREQLLQQESWSSLEKKKILGLHIWLAEGSSEETKAHYSQMSCGNPQHQPGPGSAGTGLQGGHWGQRLGLPCPRHRWSQPAQTNPLQGRLSPQPCTGHPWENRSEGRAENARWRKGEGTPRSEEEVLHSKAGTPCSPRQNPSWSRRTLLTGMQPLEPTLEQKKGERRKEKQRTVMD